MKKFKGREDELTERTINLIRDTYLTKENKWSWNSVSMLTAPAVCGAVTTINLSDTRWWKSGIGLRSFVISALGEMSGVEISSKVAIHNIPGNDLMHPSWGKVLHVDKVIVAATEHRQKLIKENSHRLLVGKDYSSIEERSAKEAGARSVIIGSFLEKYGKDVDKVLSIIREEMEKINPE